MSFALYNMVVRLFLVTSLMVPGVQNLLQGEEFEQVRNAYEQTLREREGLVEQLREREAEYRVLLEQVDRVKGGPNTLQNRMELEELLRDSRQLAGQMESIQKRIHAAERRLANQRTQLVSTLDAAMKQLESRLAQSTASERGELVSRLNELRSQRQQYTSPLPSAPSDGEVDQALAMLDELDSASAGDLLAAADELEDTEDQVRQRLQAISERLGQLRSAKLLARRARTFSSEDSFFDETSRSRFIAGHNTSNERAAAGNGNTGSNNENAVNSDDDTASMNNSVGGAAGEEMDYGAAPDGDQGQDGFAGEPNSRGEGDVSDQPEEPASAPEPQDDGSSDDIFGSNDNAFIDSSADPETMGASGFHSDTELEARIRRLEEERERLEGQARELEEKAGQLRKRAHDSLD